LKEDINERQKAINELSKELDWRQKFNAEGMLIKEYCVNPEELFIWGKEENKLYRNKAVIILSYILPIITIILIILPFINPAVPYQIRLVAISIQIIILVPGNDKRNLALNTIYKYKDSIKVYEKMLQCIVNKEFKSNQLNNLKNNINQLTKYGAIDGINELIRTADMLSDRKNLFYIVIDILFLWDYHCMFRLERWRNLYGTKLKIWLDTIAEFEVLCSLSNIAYDNEEWVYPEIRDNEGMLSAKELGHPLLGENKVCNNINMTKPVSVLLITGSNMSGKSTFLRTIGINLVLAYCGAPVCAKNFKCSIMDIYTCMRIRDDLEQSISSFYAEILRIKTIVEATKANKKVFFLLDEIFKGTNSVDRHIGAKVLIKQIGDAGASGLVSTHDLELGELEKEYTKVKNYHFQEYYEDNELRFDYKLRQGVSTTRNALYIIKMAGIELKE
jgi:DNA mismatch repair ATPase MutS